MLCTDLPAKLTVNEKMVASMETTDTETRLPNIERSEKGSTDMKTPENSTAGSVIGKRKDFLRTEVMPGE